MKGQIGKQKRMLEVLQQEKLREAAPLLLDALKDALKSVEFERGNFRPWHNKARAAIAAIKGDLWEMK